MMRPLSAIRSSLLVGCVFCSLGQSSPGLRADPPHVCDDCAEWNKAHEPFRLFGNTFYVGTAGLSSVLITSSAGHILVDGALPQSAPLIDANIRALGFRTEDVRLIVSSHPHYDHAGGIAALQRASGARVAASASGARALEGGGPTPDDPQFGFGRKANEFPAVSGVTVVRDGETPGVGELAITAHLTPGHTPGSTTWSWRSCDGPRCYDIVYGDSLTAVSAPGFRFTGDRSHPGLVDEFRRSISKVADLPCDILVTAHPAFADLDGKLARRKSASGNDPFVDPNSCRAYAADLGKRLDARVADERK
jgi:metallo-beta-lactamase class B